MSEGSQAWSPLGRAEEAARIYAEIAERSFFKHMLGELRKVVGTKAAAGLVFRIVKASMREAVEEVLPKGMVGDPRDALLLCYRLFEAAGHPFEVELSEDGARVTRCPHYRFTGRDPVACVACAATKAGALEALTGRKVAVVLDDEGGVRLGPPDAEIEVHRLTHMPKGDPACAFKLVARRTD